MRLRFNSYRRLFKQKQHNIRIQKQLPPTATNICLHCGHVYVGRYCPNCGQKAKVQRLTMIGIIEESAEIITNFDHSFIRTLVELFYRPGYMIRDYLQGHRICYFKPIQLLAFMTTLYLAVSYLLEFDANEVFKFTADINGEKISNDGVGVLEDMEVAGQFGAWIKKIVEAIQENELLTTLGGVIMFAIPARFCFRRTPFGIQMNLTEHFYARVYMSCQALVIKTFMLPFEHFGINSVSDWQMVTIGLLTVWDYAQLMEIKMRRSMRLCFATLCLMILLLILLFTPIIGIIYYLTDGIEIK